MLAAGALWAYGELMIHVVLFEPQIPQNTATSAGSAPVTRSRLHLIHPLGFRITDRHLKRAGMDYWRALDVHHHENWEAFQHCPERPERLWLFTTKFHACSGRRDFRMATASVRYEGAADVRIDCCRRGRPWRLNIPHAILPCFAHLSTRLALRSLV